MSETVVVERYPAWTKRERELYAGALVRVLGEVNYRGLLLVELMSGELQGERRWMSEAELVRTNAENDCMGVAEGGGGMNTTTAPHTCTVTIPGKLERGLSPNGRLHWRAKDRLRRQAIHDTTYVMRAAIDLNDPAACFQTAPWPLTLNWTIGLVGRQTPFDDDNAIAALKAHRDAIATALGMDDRHFRTGTLTQVRDPERRGFVRVEIVAAEGEAS